MSKFKNLNAVRGISEALLKGNNFSNMFKETVDKVMESEFIEEEEKDFDDIIEEMETKAPRWA